MDTQIARQYELIGARFHRSSSDRILHYPVLLRSLILIKKAAFLTNIKEHPEYKSYKKNYLSLCDEMMKITKYNQEELAQRKYTRYFSIDPWAGGGGVLINREINTFLSYKLKLPISLINKNQSTSDVLWTAGRISIAQELPLLTKELTKLISLLQKKEKEAQGLNFLMMARTCLQDAFPTAWDSYLKGLTLPLKRGRDALKRHQSSFQRSNLAGTVIGTGEGASAYYKKSINRNLNKCLNFEITEVKNKVDVSQNNDDYQILAQAIERILDQLIKISKDLRLLSSGPNYGLGEIQLKNIMAGSSFFPNKNNPTIAETMIGLAVRIKGYLHSLELYKNFNELNLNVYDIYSYLLLSKSIKELKEFLPHFRDKGLNSIQYIKNSTSKHKEPL